METGLSAAKRASRRAIRYIAVRLSSSARKRGAAYAAASALLKHYFRGLDHGGNGIADFEIHFLSASPGDHAFDRIFAHADCYMSHHAIYFKLNNFPFDFVPC